MSQRIPDEKVVTLGNDLTFLKFNDAYYEEHKNDRGRIKIEKTLRTIYPEEGSVVKREERELEIRWDSRDRIHVEVTRGTQGPRRVQHATRFMVPVPVEPAWLENTITQLGRSLSIGGKQSTSPSSLLQHRILIGLNCHYRLRCPYNGIMELEEGRNVGSYAASHSPSSGKSSGIYKNYHKNTCVSVSASILPLFPFRMSQLDIHAFEGSLGANALESLVFFIGR